jgi:ferredoxin
MTRIRFVSSAGACLAEVEAHPGENLLDLARMHDIPLHWRCGQGTCGTCKVHLEHENQPAASTLSRKERNVMLRAKLISEEQAASEIAIDQADAWRLACHCIIGEQNWTVVVPTPD